MRNRILSSKTRVVVFTLLFIALVNNNAFAQNSLPYIGQTPPGMSPIKFAPNNSYLANWNWWWRSSPSFSPDGNEMYFVKYFTGNETHEIWYTKCVNDQWTVPLKAPFSTSTFDSNPLFLESNDTLYYYSQRPEGFIFMATRVPTGWAEPVALEIPVPSNCAGVTSFCITKSKTIYFAMLDSSISAPNIWSTADIYRTEFVNNHYTQPENIGSPINTDVGEVVGYVEPNERFMIYSSPKQGGYGEYDLYLSTKNENGTWNDPINLGAQINTFSEDDCATITPDGKYFFFTTLKSGDNGYSPYWVNADVIKNLIPFVGIGETKEKQMNNGVLFQNEPNPCNSETTISFQLEKPSVISLVIYDLAGNNIHDLIKHKMYQTGTYEIKFDTSKLQAGIYTYSLKTESGEILSKKILVVK